MMEAKFSAETLDVFADLLGQVVLPLNDPEFEVKAAKLAQAKRELGEARQQVEIVDQRAG